MPEKVFELFFRINFSDANWTLKGRQIHCTVRYFPPLSFSVTVCPATIARDNCRPNVIELARNKLRSP